MTSPIVETVLSGSNRQLTRLAAQGMLPIAPEELIGVQVLLARSGDEEMASLARQSLEKAERQVVVRFLGEQADEGALAYFARESKDRQVIEAVLRRRDVSGSLLRELAPRLPAQLQEILLLRQDRIANDPEILEALEHNPELSAFSVRRISEYRSHLVAHGEGVEAPVAEPEEELPFGERPAPPALDDPEVLEALEAVRVEPVEGEVDEVTGLSENQIKLLPIPIRLKLARGASKALRNLLLRDNNAQVALAVISSNPISDQEIEHIARSRNVIEDVLEYISRQRRWVGKYPITVSLVSNPRTPINVALKLILRLSIRDLRNLSRDRNVSEPVRAQARRLFKVKSG